METYTLACKIVEGGLLHDSGNSNGGSTTTSRGGMGREVGGDMYAFGSFKMYGRNQHHIAIILQLNKRFLNARCKKRSVYMKFKNS